MSLPLLRSRPSERQAADPRDGKSETEAAAMKVVDLEGNTFDVSNDLSETVRGNRGEAAMTIPL